MGLYLLVNWGGILQLVLQEVPKDHEIFRTINSRFSFSERCPKIVRSSRQLISNLVLCARVLLVGGYQRCIASRHALYVQPELLAVIMISGQSFMMYQAWSYVLHSTPIIHSFQHQSQATLTSSINNGSGALTPSAHVIKMLMRNEGANAVKGIAICCHTLPPFPCMLHGENPPQAVPWEIVELPATSAMTGLLVVAALELRPW